MPTDLRAALRAAADELADIAENERIATKQYRGGIADADACDAIAARLRALADAPPTVAEMLTLVDATHEVRWTLDDDERRATGDDAGTLAFQWRTVGGSLWSEAYPSVADLAQPARLVEVAP